MIDTLPLRRTLFPLLAKTPFGEQYKKFTNPIKDVEFVGIVSETPQTVCERLESVGAVYPAQFASVKYVTTEDGSERYERGSYAHREKGLFGLWQTHMRLYECAEGVAIYAHYERNPLINPILHYKGRGWSAEEGVPKARSLLDDEFALNTDVTPKFVSKPKRNSKTNALIKSIAIPLIVAAFQLLSKTFVAHGLTLTEDLITGVVLFLFALVMFYAEELLKDKQIAQLSANSDMANEQIQSLADRLGEFTENNSDAVEDSDGEK